jgi:hypothetical protein
MTIFAFFDSTSGDYSHCEEHVDLARAQSLTDASMTIVEVTSFPDGFVKPSYVNDAWVESATAPEQTELFEAKRQAKAWCVTTTVAKRFNEFQNNPVAGSYLMHAYRIIGEEAYDLKNETAPDEYRPASSRNNGGVRQRPILEAVAAKYGETVAVRAALVEPKANGYVDLFAVTEPIRQWHYDQVMAATDQAGIDAAWAAFIVELDTALPLP